MPPRVMALMPTSRARNTITASSSENGMARKLTNDGRKLRKKMNSTAVTMPAPCSSAARRFSTVASMNVACGTVPCAV